MIATIQYHSKKYQIDLSKPIDISIALQPEGDNVHAWYIPPAKIYPVEFEGSKMLIADGAAVNFNTIEFNPHAHITHTECVGHITEKVHSVNSNMQQYFFVAEVLTVAPEKKGDDFVISKKQIKSLLGNKKRDALIIRTIPNLEDKKVQQYSHTNPPYFLEEVALYLRDKGIKHLLVDLPSVDKEEDEGKLTFHNAFWKTIEEPDLQATITEFIYVPNHIEDGVYLLNLMIAPFENDATPSKPILYKPMC